MQKRKQKRRESQERKSGLGERPRSKRRADKAIGVGGGGG